MVIFDREDVIDLVLHLDDPEELCADLVDAATMVVHDGDVSELEEILARVAEFLEVSDFETQKSWREFQSDIEPEEHE